MTRILQEQGWRRVDLLDRIDSTNAFAAQTLSPWRITAAHEQFAGRGRLARQWQAPAGSSVAVSATVPLPPWAADWGWVPLYTGITVLDACEAVLPEARFALKWPNDVLARDNDGVWRKVAGILCQAHTTGQPPLVVAGVGLNVAQAREELPVPTATSLHLLGARISRDDALAELARRLFVVAETWATERGRARLRRQVRERCSTIGSDIVVHTAAGEHVPTRAVGIDDTGCLLTQVTPTMSEPTPRVVPYSAADVEHVRPSER